jgi:hypothetical protein
VTQLYGCCLYSIQCILWLSRTYRFRCVLRIRADDPTARVQLGLKYGADMSDAPKLLEAAKGLGLQVQGDTSANAAHQCAGVCNLADPWMSHSILLAHRLPPGSTMAQQCSCTCCVFRTQTVLE